MANYESMLSSPTRMIEFIERHPLPVMPFRHSLLSAPALPDNLAAAVVGASIMSFAAGLLAQTRRDLYMSNLYAQQIASTDDDDVDVDGFERYTQILQGLGNSKARRLTVRRAVPGTRGHDEIEYAMTQAGPEYGQLTRQALAALQDNRSALELFQQESKFSISAQFQVLSCASEKDNVVDIALYHREFVYEPGVPWWSWGGTKAHLAGVQERLHVVPFRLDAFHDYRQPLHKQVADYIQSKIAVLATGD